jgi:hypothetical protein
MDAPDELPLPRQSLERRGRDVVPAEKEDPVRGIVEAAATGARGGDEP